MRSGTGTGTGKGLVRRVATVMAAVGALLVSSGFALMATPTPAGANPTEQVVVCHGNSSSVQAENPYIGYDLPAPAAAAHAGHMHWWNGNVVWHGTFHADGTNKPDIINPPGATIQEKLAYCNAEATVVYATASVNFVDPSCANDNEASYTTAGEHVTFQLIVGTVAPGHFVKIKATATGSYRFEGGATHRYFEHTFGAVQDCNLYDATAGVQWVEPVCENQNTADYTTSGEHVTFAVTDGSVAPGETVEITATADAGHMFAGDPPSATKVFTHTFDPAQVGCEPLGPIVPEPPTFVDPTCTTDPAVQLPDVANDAVSYQTVGDVIAGGSVTVTATAVPPAEFAEGVATSWQHTFTVPTGCTIVSPPTESPTTATEPATETTTPTVVHAGLAGDTSTTSRTEQGLGLAFAGLLMMAGAGRLVLAKGGARR